MNNENPISQSSPIFNGQNASEQLVPSPIIPDTNSANDNKSNTPNIKRLVKIALGLLVLIPIILFIFFVIISNFTKNSSGGITITYWGLWEDKNIMAGVIAEFERLNPTIKVDYIKQDPKQYRERLATRIKSGTGPDIFRFHNTWYSMLSSSLLPLPSDTISKEDFNKSFYPVAQKDLVKNGAIYGIPLEIDTLSLFINNDLLQSVGLSAPTTWNDFINDARAMTVKDEQGKIKTAGAAMGTFDNITHAPDILSLLFLQNGVDFKNITASSDRIQGAFNFYTSYATDENNVWDNTLDPSLLAFSKGNLGMFFGYSWDYFNIKQFNPELSFQIVPVPQLPNQNISLASYWAEGVSLKSKHQKEALLFMKYLAQKETAQKLYTDESKTRAFGEPYARVDLADSLKSNQIIYPFVQQAPNASSSFFVDSTFDNGLNQQLNTYLGNAVNSILNSTSIQTAFETFSQGVTQIMQKYGE